MEVTTILGGLKTAIDIAKALKDSSKSLKDAEIKMKLVELMDALANAKQSVATLKDDLLNKDQEIQKLKGLLEFKEQITFNGLVYVDKQDSSVLYCPKCYGESGQGNRLMIVDEALLRCPVCDFRCWLPGEQPGRKVIHPGI
ncbi:MAG: hypothetical protein NPIRA02_40280 [Nitrospirales bacterium]|nr:MAG: hypothetical protein NPIRA02_40280 [Nitrospirales bacterium]